MVATSDFLVIGGGVIGINVARQIKHRFADAKVTLIEKEPRCGLAASGRTAVCCTRASTTRQTASAKFTRGNRLMTEYFGAERPPDQRGKLGG
jgi:L-2-hydroxyglutarate oxidase LhgO